MTIPWTVSRGPIVASEIDIQKADAINALLVRPIGILPERPGDLIRPFAIGLFEEIRRLLKPGVGMTTLRGRLPPSSTPSDIVSRVPSPIPFFIIWTLGRWKP